MSAYQRKLQHGFTLVEAMVALVVVSVGMIGIAALYSQGLGAGRTAQFRTQAVNLVADMADRIRVNRIGQAAYGAGGADGGCDPQTGAALCAPAQMAAHDIFVWTQQVQQLLPNGQGQVAFNAGGPASFTIQVSWDEVGLGNISHQVVIQVPNI